MEGWFQLDWFSSDWNASSWNGAEGSTNGVTFSTPLIEAVGTVGSSSITGSGTVTIEKPATDGYGYQFRRSSGRGRKAVDEGLLLLERWRAQEDEVVLAAIQAFVQLEEEAWELSPIA